MSVTVHLSPEVEEQLRSRFPDLDRRVLEGYAVHAYSRGELSSFQVGQLLGFENRWETIEFLSAHGVYPNYDLEDFEEDMRNLERLKEKLRG
jgi:predicted HTH domain antitoxin